MTTPLNEGTVPAAVPADQRQGCKRCQGDGVLANHPSFIETTRECPACNGTGYATSAPPPVEAREPSDDTVRVERSRRLEVNFQFESLPPVDGMDRIYAEYRKTFGRYPDAFMSQVVAQTKEDLFVWWAAHRERIREALVLADPGEGERNRLIDEQMKRDLAATHPKEPTEAREASAEGARGLTNWQPIETVPKDGREVILREGSRVGAACWVEWPGTYYYDGTPNQDGGEGWTVGYDGDEWRNPTAWQPMPPAPGMVEEPSSKGDGRD